VTNKTHSDLWQSQSSPTPEACQFNNDVIPNYAWSYCVHWFRGLPYEIRSQSNKYANYVAFAEICTIMHVKFIQERICIGFKSIKGSFPELHLSLRNWVTISRSCATHSQNQYSVCSWSLTLNVLASIRSIDYYFCFYVVFVIFYLFYRHDHSLRHDLSWAPPCWR